MTTQAKYVARLTVLVVLVALISPSEICRANPGWTEPVLIGRPPDGASLYVENGKRASSTQFYLACGMLTQDGEVKAAALVVDLRGLSAQLLLPDSMSSCKRVTLARIGSNWHLVWNYPAGPLPDGFDRYKLMTAQISESGIANVQTLADSVDLYLDATSAGGVAYIVAKQIYSGIQYRKAALLFRLSGSKIERLALPQGEWSQPFVACQDSNTVHVVGWSGFAVQYAVSHNGGSSWLQPQIPSGLTSMQHPAIGFWNSTMPVLLWEKDENNDIWPDKILAVHADRAWQWSESSCLSCPWNGQRVGSRKLSLFATRVKGRWPRLYVTWTEGEKAWSENQDTYFSYFDGHSWSQKQRVLSGTRWLGNPQIFVDPQGIVHIFGTDYVDSTHIGIWYTHSTEPITGVDNVGGHVAAAFELEQPRPNPFNGSTVVRYALKRAGTVLIRVVDVNGRAVKTFVHNQQQPGPHTIRWNGTDDNGRPLPSGVYIVRLEAGGQVATRKVVLVR